MGNTERLAKVFHLVYEANGQDPNIVIIHEEDSPNTSEALKRIARCPLICQWEIPRERCELNPLGYMKWHQELKRFQENWALVTRAMVG